MSRNLEFTIHYEECHRLLVRFLRSHEIYEFAVDIKKRYLLPELRAEYNCMLIVFEQHGQSGKEH